MKQRFILVSITLLVVVLLMAVVSCGPAPTPAPTPAAPSTPTPSVTPTSPQSRGATGTLAKINGNTLTLTTAQGSVMVNISSNTIIQKTATGTSSDIHEGASIFVTGNQDANGNITATSISIQPERQNIQPTPPATAPRNQGGTTTPRQRQGARGTVTKIDGTVLTLNTAQGPVTVNVSSNTAIQKTVTGSISDLHEGESLSVRGSQDANSNITATSIRIQPEGQGAPNPPAGA